MLVIFNSYFDCWSSLKFHIWSSWKVFFWKSSLVIFDFFIKDDHNSWSSTIVIRISYVCVGIRFCHQVSVSPYVSVTICPCHHRFLSLYVCVTIAFCHQMSLSPDVRHQMSGYLYEGKSLTKVPKNKLFLLVKRLSRKINFAPRSWEIQRFPKVLFIEYMRSSWFIEYMRRS